VRGGGLAADDVRTGDTRGQPAATGAGRCHGMWEQGGACGPCVRPWAGRGKKELGQAQENNADFDLNQIFKLNQI
jgi:hypothetical protein